MYRELELATVVAEVEGEEVEWVGEEGEVVELEVEWQQK